MFHAAIPLMNIKMWLQTMKERKKTCNFARYNIQSMPRLLPKQMNRNRLLTIFAFIFAFIMPSAGQTKFSPWAQLALKKQKVAAQEAKGKRTNAKEAPRAQLVLTVDAKDGAQTFAQIRQTGATVLSKLGRQAVVSIPANRVYDLAGIDGVTYIDAPQKGRLATDHSLVETRVSEIDGSAEDGGMAYTGEGVTICVVDMGFDFQHPAFKDANGNSRLRCVYLPYDEGGRKFTVEDAEAGTITYPGSVYDTPELIATLTTDSEEDYHGTHTASIAAGTRSPLGFGGMAPEADIVLVSAKPLDDWNANEICLQFAAHYADQIEQPMVVSCSMNDHSGFHDGTGTMPELVSELSNHAIPVFAAGNDGDGSVHIHKLFTETDHSMKAFLALPMSVFDENDNRLRVCTSVVTGASRNVLNETDELKVVIRLNKAGVDELVWNTDTVSLGFGQKNVYYIESEDDEGLSQHMTDGFVFVSSDLSNGRLLFTVAIYGNLTSKLRPTIWLDATEGMEIDMWEQISGFFEPLNPLEGYTYGDSEMSAGDWTTTERVISVGSYVANNISRNYTGSTIELDYQVINDISSFSSYGAYLNGVKQPFVCAPGSNVVSAYNHYACDEEMAESMQWQGYPYSSLSGTSMACPHVSGIIALWLQANPHLNLDDVKELISRTSRHDEFTAVAPLRWGEGKIDAAAGAACLQMATGISEAAPLNDNGEMINDDWYAIDGRRLSGKPTAAGLYINNKRVILIR